MCFKSAQKFALNIFSSRRTNTIPQFHPSQHLRSPQRRTAPFSSMCSPAQPRHSATNPQRWPSGRKAGRSARQRRRSLRSCIYLWKISRLTFRKRTIRNTQRIAMGLDTAWMITLVSATSQSLPASSNTRRDYTVKGTQSSTHVLDLAQNHASLYQGVNNTLAWGFRLVLKRDSRITFRFHHWYDWYNNIIIAWANCSECNSQKKLPNQAIRTFTSAVIKHLDSSGQ